MKLLRDNSLTIVLFIVTVLCITGMIIAGLSAENAELASHSKAALDLRAYLTSGAFLSALFENWESEFLQMAAYVTLTAIFFQRGSAESRDPDDPERDGDELPHEWQGRHLVAQWIYAHSLSLALIGLFSVSFALHWMGSWNAANDQAVLHGEPFQSAWSYIQNPRFWFESFQNWQSEFLSTGVLVVLSIFLRYKNSPESKPVSSPNIKTGS